MRGVSQASLSELAGASHTTIRTAERDVEGVRASTWRQLLTALAGVAPFNRGEIAEIADALDWQPSVVAAINREAQSKRVPVDRRTTARSRIAAVLEEHDDLAEHLADLLESLARVVHAARSSGKADGSDAAAAVQDALAHAVRVTEPTGGSSLRVVLPAERRPDGSLVERFEYFTPDGRRLVPTDDLPPKPKPKARPLRDGTGG